MRNIYAISADVLVVADIVRRWWPSGSQSVDHDRLVPVPESPAGYLPPGTSDVRV